MIAAFRRTYPEHFIGDSSSHDIEKLLYRMESLLHIAFANSW